MVIQDQDCEPRRLGWLQEHLGTACAGVQGPPWIAGVSIECTENWLLCRDWPPKVAHAECSKLAHPRELGCADGKNRAKAVFNELYGIGLDPRREAAQHIARHARAAAWLRLREADDFRALYDDLVAAARGPT